MSNPKKPAGVELDATLFSGPAELATSIREHCARLYSDGVFVKCGRARHRVTLESCDAVCRGLLLASEMASEAQEKLAKGFTEEQWRDIERSEQERTARQCPKCGIFGDGCICHV